MGQGSKRRTRSSSLSRNSSERTTSQDKNLEGEEIPTPAEAEEIVGPEIDEGSEPEAERIPESLDASMEAPLAEESGRSLPVVPSENSSSMSADEIARIQQLSQALPVPEEDEEFGDCYICGSDVVWEIDVTPPDTWELPKQLDESMIFLASEGRKKRVEVKQRFALAKHKEIRAWLSHAMVRKIAKGKIPAKNIMRCRWIYTWKPAAETDEANPDGKKAKARLVVLGFEDPDMDHVPNDAPTLSKDGRQLLLQKICSNRWKLCSFDISTAFLHGKGDGRQLGIQAPPELQEALNMGPQDDCGLDGGAYGRIDAPYLWYQEFRKELLGLGFQQSPFDPCVSVLSERNENGLIHHNGILGIHVDDGICGGDSRFHAVLNKLRSRFSFGSFEEKDFVFTGIHLHQWDDGSIEMDQCSYVESIEAIDVPRQRRKNPDSSVTEPERQRLRRLVGSLQYAAVHTRADLSAKVGELQSAINSACVSHLLLGNKVLHEAKSHRVSIMIVPIEEQQVTFCAFSDASFASCQKLSAHQGTIIFATHKKLLENQTAVVCPMAWSSKRIPRVVRSTLGAEAFALSNSVDRLSWLRLFWAWLKDPSVPWQHPEKVLELEPTAAAATDCKSVYDIVTRTAPPQCEEYRTTIECLLIRQRMQENCKLRWVASGAQLADCLTKAMDAHRLRECLRTGWYSLFDEGRVLKERSDNRKQLQWVKQSNEASNKADCLNSQHARADFWSLNSSKAILDRVHVVPRRVRFTPVGVGECPVGLGDLEPLRTTIATASDSGKRFSSTDTWVGQDARRSEVQEWTGLTRFATSLHSQLLSKLKLKREFLMSVIVQHCRSSTS